MKRNTKKLTEAMEENAFAYALTRKSLQNATNALIDGKNVVDTSSPRPSKNIGFLALLIAHCSLALTT